MAGKNAEIEKLKRRKTVKENVWMFPFVPKEFPENINDLLQKIEELSNEKETIIRGCLMKRKTLNLKSKIYKDNGEISSISHITYWMPIMQKEDIIEKGIDLLSIGIHN